MKTKANNCTLEELQALMAFRTEALNHALHNFVTAVKVDNAFHFITLSALKFSQLHALPIAWSNLESFMDLPQEVLSARALWNHKRSSGALAPTVKHKAVRRHKWGMVKDSRTVWEPTATENEKPAYSDSTMKAWKDSAEGQEFVRMFGEDCIPKHLRE